MNSTTPPIAAYWVLPEHFLAGPHPGPHTPYDPDPSLRLRYLLSLGADSFFDLTSPGDAIAYETYLQGEAAVLGKTVSYQRFPIPDYAAPETSQMVAILNAIDAALQAGRVVYVHCYAGIGRTGTVVGCYLARHGLTGKPALDKIRELRSTLPNSWASSPESDEQYRLVLYWQAGN
jgi:hypothetical protein